jgi:tetratricopeptide (TPR) repeat protein
LIPNTYGTGDKQNQIIEGYLSTLSHLKNVLKKKQKLLKLDQAETADTDESQSTTKDRLTIQSSLQKLFELDQKLHSPNDLSLAAGYNYIANLSCSVGDYLSALSCFDKALGIIPSSLPSNHPLLAKTCSNMAKALDKLGRYKDAIDYARQAVDTARCNLESTNAEIEAYEQQLHQLQRKV